MCLLHLFGSLTISCVVVTSNFVVVSDSWLLVTFSFVFVIIKEAIPRKNLLLFGNFPKGWGVGRVNFCQKHPNISAEIFYCVFGCTDQPQTFSG